MAAMTKVFRFPPSVAGAGVDPTAAQMAQLDGVVVDITTDAGAGHEDPLTVAHNMACPTVDGSDGSPEVLIVPLTAGSVASGLKYAYTSANVLTFTKAISGVNTAYVWRVTIRRPFSVGQ